MLAARGSLDSSDFCPSVQLSVRFVPADHSQHSERFRAGALTWRAARPRTRLPTSVHPSPPVVFDTVIRGGHVPDSLKDSTEVEVDLVVARDLEDRWPELFVGLSTTQRRDVVAGVIAEWRAGLPVTYDAVLAHTEEKRGLIDPPEYL